jgi:hypothetical protein
MADHAQPTRDGNDLAQWEKNESRGFRTTWPGAVKAGRVLSCAERAKGEPGAAREVRGDPAEMRARGRIHGVP